MQLACTTKPQTVEDGILSVSQLFADHMVLQQKEKATFWGRSIPKKEVEISTNWGEHTSTTTDANGRWKVALQTPTAGGPYQIEISSNGESLIIKDVLIGEVWLASGQSNMEMPLYGWRPNDTIVNSDKEIAKADMPDIRFMKVEHHIAESPLDSLEGNWQVVSPETAKDFSATAYFYAKKLHSELKVPIGIIQSAVGGTPAEAWTSEQSLKQLDDFQDPIAKLKKTARLKKEWFKKFNSQKIPSTENEWERIDFEDLEASTSQYDDASWDSIRLPSRIDVLKNDVFDGAIWLRKSFLISDVKEDYQLEIGSIDDMDAIYINGKKVGGLTGFGHANAPRKMNVPKAILIEGMNCIAIRIIDTGGPGSIMGDMVLSNSSNNNISLTGIWKSRQVGEIANQKFYSYGLKDPLSDRPVFSQYNTNSPTVLYNAMINPLVPYTLKGVIWYQGESNVGRAEQYITLFPMMIKDWRTKWRKELPFYFVQLAPYKYSGYQKESSQMLRNAQRLALKTPKTGMVVTLDIGNLKTVHPARKREVGERLARIALVDQYGREMVSSGPLYKDVEVSGDKLIIAFDNVGTGLVTTPHGLTGFEIAGNDKFYLPAIAEIKNDKVVVFNPDIKRPMYVRYAWSDESMASLFNEDGLPAATFTSEEM